VPVPDIFRASTTERPAARKRTSEDKKISTWNQIYDANGIRTRLVLMEERNVYCGAYNVLLLRDEYVYELIYTITIETRKTNENICFLKEKTRKKKINRRLKCNRKYLLTIC